METCGYIMCNDDSYENFIIRCSQCSKDTAIDSWQEFLLHFVGVHKSKDIADHCQIEEVTVDESYLDKENHILVLEREVHEIQGNPKVSELITISDSSASEDEQEIDDETASESELSEEEEKEEIKSKQSADKFIPSFYKKDPRFIKFVEIYKDQPCIWNIKHEKYRESTACKIAYQTIIARLEAEVGITFTEDDLLTAIKQLHFRLRACEKRFENGILKESSLVPNYFTSCNFLQAGNDPVNSFYKIGSFEFDFTTKNNFVTTFIQLYAKYPLLYDQKHNDFASMECRRQAYATMREIITEPNTEIYDDDIYLGIQSVRQWYYRNREKLAETGNEAEKFYLNACAFLSPHRFTQKFFCEICALKTTSDNVLQLHKFKVHNIGELPFKCYQCDRNFSGRSELATHRKRVHIGKVHNCPHCDRSFAVYSDLKVHIRTHVGPKILCELCGKAFRLKSQLTLHMTAVHTKIRAYKCDMCPKDFLKRVHLTDHIKSHLNIRDKICSTCGKGFTSCHSLIRHRQIHSEIKKFACKLCDARFKQFVGLNSHMKRTHKIAKNNAQKTAETETLTELTQEEFIII